MPITFDLKPDQLLVIFRHVGNISDDEFLTFYKNFFEKPGATDYLNLLIDLEQTKSIDRSAQALQSLAQFLREKLAGSPVQRRVAVVAPADISFGLARMYEVFNDPANWEFVVFRDNGAARVWLDVSTGSEVPGIRNTGSTDG